MKLTENMIRRIVRRVISEQFKPNFHVEDMILSKCIVRTNDLINVTASYAKFNELYEQQMGEHPYGHTKTYVREKILQLVSDEFHKNQ